MTMRWRESQKNTGLKCRLWSQRKYQLAEVVSRKFCSTLQTGFKNTRNTKPMLCYYCSPLIRYGNQGILLNSDGLKQFLFGPIDGPPRNTIQIGMPG